MRANASARGLRARVARALAEIWLRDRATIARDVNKLIKHANTFCDNAKIITHGVLKESVTKPVGFNI